MKGMPYLLLLVTLLASHNVFAAMPVFGTSSESKRAQEFAAPKDKAIIYIYQLEKDGTGVSPRIWLNNYEIGRLVPGAFSVWKLSPGRLSIRVEGTDRASVSMFTKAGKVYLFRLDAARASAGPRVRVTSLPESFRADLKSTRLLKNPRTVTSVATTKPAMPVAPVKPAMTSKPAMTAEPEPQQQPETQISSNSVTYQEPGGIGVMLKAGVLTLSEDTQTILGSARQFDDSASGPLGLEAYYQFGSGFTIGGEVLKYSAEFTTVGMTDVHDVDVLIIMGNAKKYFRTSSSIQPYIGAGLGVASTDVSGPTIGGSTSGLAYQAMLGLEFRGASVGGFGEFKYISADTEDDNSEHIDVSGMGLFAGIAFYF